MKKQNFVVSKKKVVAGLKIVGPVLDMMKTFSNPRKSTPQSARQYLHRNLNFSHFLQKPIRFHGTNKTLHFKSMAFQLQPGSKDPSTNETIIFNAEFDVETYENFWFVMEVLLNYFHPIKAQAIGMLFICPCFP